MVTGALTMGAAAPIGPRGDNLSPDITAIMNKSAYKHAQWGLLEVDNTTGRVIHSQYPDQFFIPGSTAKLVSVSGAWDALGGDHRFTTPSRPPATATARCSTATSYWSGRAI